MKDSSASEDEKSIWRGAVTVFVTTLVAVVLVGGCGSSSQTSTTGSPIDSNPGSAPPPNTDASAILNDIRKNFPKEPAPGESLLTRDEAIALARNPMKLTPNVGTAAPLSDDAPVWAESGKFSDFAARTGDGGNEGIDPDTPVWLVTVRTPVFGRPGGLASGKTGAVQSHYTVLIAAANGRVISFCGGCAALDPDAPPTTEAGR